MWLPNMCIIFLGVSIGHGEDHHFHLLFKNSEEYPNKSINKISGNWFIFRVNRYHKGDLTFLAKLVLFPITKAEEN